MQIAEFKTFVVANPPPYYGGRYFIFVKLVSNDGIVGYGEIYAGPFHPVAVEHMIADVCERVVVGSNPFHIEKLWRRLYSRGFSQRTDISMMGIASGIEIACWDIVGKALDKPVYELLGGRVHEKLRTYTYLYPADEDSGDAVYENPDLAAQRALEYADLGFTAIKFDPTGPYTDYDPRQLSLSAMQRSVAFVKRIREAVGTRCDLLFGTHGQMTPASAIRLAKKMELYDPLWFEEPTPPDNLDAMAKVARATSIPLAAGERLATKYEFARVLNSGAAAILQPALGRAGGILEGKKIAALAEAHYAQIAPHLYCGPIEGAANIQLDTCTPNFLIQESIQTWGGFHSEILVEPIQWEDGYIIPSTKPGIGVTLNEAVAAANPYHDDALHLDMLDRPFTG